MTKAERKAARKVRKTEARARREALKPAPAVSILQGGKKGMQIPAGTLARSRIKAGMVTAEQFLAVPRPPPGVLPDGLKNKANPVLAMDEQAEEMSVWAAGTWASGWFDGPLFKGYPALSLFAALPEYRRMAEVLATECTRRWIRIGAADSNDKAKLEKVTKLETELKRLDLRGAMRRLIEQDAFFGVAHLYLDVGTDPDDRDELAQSIGNGRNEATRTKFQGKTDFLRGLKPIEAVWCYPSKYNATNPLRDDWYKPQTWFCQGKEIHSTRLMTFVGREVPDLLKPAYMFGGISLSQLMQPYVDRWISVVDSVARLLLSFSTSGIATNLETILKPEADSQGIFDRVELFNNMRNNFGAMLLDKDTEEFFQFNTPLSELKDLITKYQEFQCSISGEPVVKLLGIQPAGLNASSQGEITSWLDWCEAFREKFCAAPLTTIIDFAQLSLFGEIDPDITWTWESLRSLDPKEETERRKVQAEMDAVYIEDGVFLPQEIRMGLLADPESPYYGLEELTPDMPEGPEGGGVVDPDMAEEFPQLEAPPAGAGGALSELGGVRIDPQARRAAGGAPDRDGPRRPDGEDPRTARRAPRESRQRQREPAE